MLFTRSSIIKNGNVNYIWGGVHYIQGLIRNRAATRLSRGNTTKLMVEFSKLKGRVRSMNVTNGD